MLEARDPGGWLGYTQMHGAYIIGARGGVGNIGHLLRVFLQSNLRYEIAPNKIGTPSLGRKINEGNMIVYQLQCCNSHEFEAWFHDSSTYEAQVKGGDVTCPFCGDADVGKAIMAPNISTSKSGPKDSDLNRAEARAKEVAEQILDAVGEIRQHVETTCDDVGDDFANEARRIHHGEVEERGIFGNATDEETEDLDEEGIEFFRLPIVRRDS